MKYLKQYKIFESNKIDLYKVKEVFYNISDKYFVKCKVSRHKLVGHRVIEILINGSSFDSIVHSTIDLDNIKDDLEFVISYMKKEMGIKLHKIHVRRGNFKTFSYDNFEELLSDNNDINSIIELIFLK